jgi:transposase
LSVQQGSSAAQSEELVETATHIFWPLVRHTPESLTICREDQGISQHRAGKLDWSRAVIDSAQAPAKRGGGKTGPNPTDRGRSGSKHHLITDRHGTPLATPLLTASNVPDVVMLIPIVDHISPVRGRLGRPRRRPTKLHADKGYASRANRRALRQRGIQPRIARKGIESSTRLGRHRWVVERSFAWLHRFRRLLIRYERDAEIHQGFLNLAAILMCWSVLTR